MLSSKYYKLLLILVALVLSCYIYFFGITGSLFYDDYGNLEGLSKIKNWSDAQHFVFGGAAGPLGRPLALLSFVPHAAGWPGNSESILIVNVFIHLANALLLGILGYLLLGLVGPQYALRRFKVAFFAALLWVAMPLLASSTLIAIQRMTGLSAFFGILGLIGFVWGYRYQYARPVLTFFLQMGILGTGTLLSMLSKENGALIPLYALLIDIFIVKSSLPVRQKLKNIRRGILMLGLISILVYLSPLMQDYFSVSEVRGYSVWDRLQTQVVVLWQYLQAAFFPSPSLYSPFHDYRGADYSGTTSLIAFSAWLAVLFICIFINLKYKLVWPIFALLWYFVGHLIESTSIMLEIYFEHRNYLSIYGFCLALAVAASSVSLQYQRLASGIFLLYVGIQFSVLFFVTSVWGKPGMAAEIWAKENPASSRAALHVVFQDLGNQNTDDIAKLNAEFIRRERYSYAIEILDRTAKNCPTCLGVRVQAIVYSCVLNKREEVINRMDGLLEVARKGKDTRVVIDVLFRIRDLVNGGKCDAIRHEEIITLIKELSENYLFKINHILTRLYFLAAALKEDMGDDVGMEEFLNMAEQASPVALPVLQYQIQLAYKKGSLPIAQAAINRRYDFVGFNSGLMTKELLDQMQRDVEKEFQENPDLENKK